MFNDKQEAIYVPSEVAPIIREIVDEIVRRKGARGNHQIAPVDTFYAANILTGARSVCEALHAPDRPQ